VTPAASQCAYREASECQVTIIGTEGRSRRVAALGNIARENAIHLVIGVIERDGGTLYCTVLFFDPTGRYLGLHRKLMPTAMERLVWGYGDGSTLPVYDASVGRLGAVSRMRTLSWRGSMAPPLSEVLTSFRSSESSEPLTSPRPDNRGRCCSKASVRFRFSEPLEILLTVRRDSRSVRAGDQHSRAAGVSCAIMTSCPMDSSL
jgi:hypothetical protein